MLLQMSSLRQHLWQSLHFIICNKVYWNSDKRKLAHSLIKHCDFQRYSGSYFVIFWCLFLSCCLIYLYFRQQLHLPECFSVTCTKSKLTCCFQYTGDHKVTWQCDRTVRAGDCKMPRPCVTGWTAFWSMETVGNWSFCLFHGSFFSVWLLNVCTKCQLALV